LTGTKYKVKLNYKTPRKAKAPKPPKVELPTEAVTETGDARVREIHRILGGKPQDYALAKRVDVLQRQIGGTATLPECVFYAELEKRGVQFTYLAQLFGGHTRLGGTEIDFLIHKGGTAIAIQVDGNYYHGRQFQLRFAQEGRDLANDLKILGATFLGMKIEHVVHVLEDAIYKKRPMVIDLALNGVGLGT
jgi:hypothetical protein